VNYWMLETKKKEKKKKKKKKKLISRNKRKRRIGSLFDTTKVYVQRKNITSF
jgi:hypothetical protein